MPRGKGGDADFPSGTAARDSRCDPGRPPRVGAATARCPTPVILGALDEGRKERAMARISVSLDADLVIEAMLLAGVSNAEDAVEVVVRDFVQRANRTEAITGNAADDRRRAEAELRRKRDAEAAGG